MTDTMFEKEDSLIKDLPPKRISAINTFTHLSKLYSNAKLEVVRLFFEILTNEQDEELRSLARKHDNGNHKDQFTYELILSCAAAPHPDNHFMLGKAILCFSVKYTMKEDEKGGNIERERSEAGRITEFGREYEPTTFKTRMGMLFGWLSHRGSSTVHHVLMKVSYHYLVFSVIDCSTSRHTVFITTLIFSHGGFVAYKIKMYSEIRGVGTYYGTKLNQSVLHASTDSIIDSTMESQPYVNIHHLHMDIHYTLLSRIYLRGGKEVAYMGWEDVVFSIHATGKFKGKRKVNIINLADKMTQITFAHTSTRNRGGMVLGFSSQLKIMWRW
jgi:hypothetical protein